MDIPAAIELIDVRPAEHFTDYNIPGSRNVDLADILDNPSFLTGVGPLVIVDRDGSIAMMVAGILSQNTQRNVKALYGGVQAYWNESNIGLSAQAMASPNQGSPRWVSPNAASLRPSAPATATPVSPEPTVTPKRKSAGC